MGLDLEFFLNLIEAVKEEPILYVKGYPGCLNKDNRASAWLRISQKIDEPQNVCEKRWGLLREKFAREVKKMSTPSNSGGSIEPVWTFFNPMSFLLPYIRTRGLKHKAIKSEESAFPNSTETSIKIRKTEDESTSDSTGFFKSYSRTRPNENNFDEPASPVPSEDDPLLPTCIVSTETSIKKSKNDDNLTAELKSLIDLYKKSLKEQEESDDSIFMKSMANLMKDLPEASKNQIRRKTFNAIMEEKEKL